MSAPFSVPTTATASFLDQLEAIDRPFRIPDVMSVDDRLLILERLAVEGTMRAPVRALAWRAMQAVAQIRVPVVRMRTLAAVALHLVQATPYRFDPAEQEWFQPAAYTALYGGDCEDKAVLLVALYHLLGIYSVVVWITQTGQPVNHVTVAVWLVDHWCWADASVAGAGLCESPYDAIARVGQSHVVTGQRAA